MTIVPAAVQVGGMSAITFLFKFAPDFEFVTQNCPLIKLLSQIKATIY